MIQENFSKADFEKILSWYNIGLFISKRYIDTAIENLNYEIITTKGKFLLKVFESKDIHALKFQNRLIHYLYSRRVKVAPLIVARNGEDIILHNGRHVSIFKFIEGKHLGKLSRQGCINLAKEISVLHRVLLSYKPGKRRGETYYSAQDKKLFSTRKLRKSTIHGDLGKSNILIRSNTVRAILDFNDASYNYLIADLANFIASVFLERGNNAYYPLFIHEYEKTIALTNDERSLLPHFIRLRVNGIVDYISIVIKRRRYKPRQLKHIKRGLKEYKNKLPFLGRMDLTRF